ncbi:MAG: S8 family serine peptidase [Candidatus Saelkia tenebricola]|nr:S8 family serine peptidase [Candidatus Saelkia tenebricola]
MKERKEMKEMKEMKGISERSHFYSFKKWIILWSFCLGGIMLTYFLTPGYRNTKRERISANDKKGSKITSEASLLEKRFSQIENEMGKEEVQDENQEFELISKTDSAEVIYLGKAFERVTLSNVESFLDNFTPSTSGKNSKNKSLLSSKVSGSDVAVSLNESKETPDTIMLAGIPGQSSPGSPGIPGGIPGGIPDGPGDVIIIDPIGGPPEDPGKPAEPVDLTKIDPNRPNFDVLVKNKLQTQSTVVVEEKEYVSGELIIKYKQGTGMSVYDFQGLTTAVIESIEPLFEEEIGIQSTTGLNNIYRMKINEDADVEAVCSEIQFKNSNVEYAEPNYVYKIMANPGDEPYFDRLWGIKKIQAPEAWSVTEGSGSILVAVVDTGVDVNHEDLRDNATGDMDVHFHGTHVAGTISGVDNTQGVIGVAPKCRILGVQVLGSNGSGSTAAIAQGIRRAVASGARVINLSLGGPGYCSVMHDAIKDAYNNNVVVVAAAGNSNMDAGNFCPAQLEEVICVAATDSSDGKASFSNWGDVVDVAAPGVGIWSSVPGNGYDQKAGTSMASPHVAGVAALILSINPSLTVDDVKNIIYQSADDLGSPGKDRYFGYGRVNADKAVNSSDAVEGLKAAITFPDSDTTIGSQISVEGTASGDAFNAYYLELEHVSSEEKILLGSKVYQKVDAGNLLDKHDLGNMIPGEYILRLIVENSQGESIKREQRIYLGLQMGFPYQLQGYIPGGIKIADIDGDGIDEIIFLATDGYLEQKSIKDTYLYVINGDGVVKKGFPVFFDMRSWATPSLSDLDDDGTLEIIVTGTKEEAAGFTSFVTAIKSDGTVLEGWGSYVGGKMFAGITPGLAVVADIDNDEIEETICMYMYPGTSDVHYQRMMVVKKDGTASELTLGLQPAYKAYYPLTLQACTPVVADIDGDGENEILISDVIDPATGEVYILAAYDGNGNVKYTVKDPEENNIALYSRIVVGDLFGAGSPEILVIRTTAKGDRSYVINSEFEIVTGWPKKFEQQFFIYEPILLDIDDDSNLEIFVKAKNEIYAWHHDGTNVSGWPIEDRSGSLKGICFGASGKIEQIIGDNVYKRDGSVSEELSLSSAGVTRNFVMDHGIGELDSDLPGPEIVTVVVGEDGYEYIDIIKLSKVTANSSSKWSMFKLNINNNALRLTEGGSPGVPGNNPPQFLNFDTFRVTGSGVLEINLNDYAHDADGDALEFSVENENVLPGIVEFDPDTDTFYWDPPDDVPGGYSGVKFTVTDSYGGKDEATPLFEFIL